MIWLQIILLVIQIIREIRGDRDKIRTALLDAGFTEQQDGSWHKSVVIKKRRRNAVEVPVIIVYADGQWSITNKGGNQKFKSVDDFETYIRILKSEM